MLHVGVSSDHVPCMILANKRPAERSKASAGDEVEDAHDLCDQ